MAFFEFHPKSSRKPALLLLEKVPAFIIQKDHNKFWKWLPFLMQRHNIKAYAKSYRPSFWTLELELIARARRQLVEIQFAIQLQQRGMLSKISWRNEEIIWTQMPVCCWSVQNCNSQNLNSPTNWNSRRHKLFFTKQQKSKEIYQKFDSLGKHVLCNSFVSKVN